MSLKIVVLLIILCSAVHLETKFPTDIDELRWIKNALKSKKKKKATFTKQDLDDPDKLQKLLEKIEKIEKDGPETPKAKKAKRKLQISQIVTPMNDQFNSIGKLISPFPNFLGVDYNNRKDFVNTGIGATALMTGLWNKRYRENKNKNLLGILENKFHLNNLYLSSIEVQNNNAQLSHKMLMRTLAKVGKTRKELLSKIHGSLNPMD